MLIENKQINNLKFVRSMEFNYKSEDKCQVVLCNVTHIDIKGMVQLWIVIELKKISKYHSNYILS